MALSSSTSSSMTCYELREVDFAYRRGRPVIRQLSLKIPTGDFCGLIGPNGAGKSTLLKLFSGRLHPRSGEIFLEGRPVADYPRKAMARLVGVIPQGEPAVFDFSVFDIVLMGRFAYRTGWFGIETAQDRQEVRRCLEMTDLADLADRPVGALSGGEKQRVLVARALAQDPEILLLDEPTTAMDPFHRKQLMDLMDRLNRDEGKTVILVTHDLSLVATYARSVCVLREGTIIHYGTAAEIMKPEILSEVYETLIGVVPVGNSGAFVGILK